MQSGRRDAKAYSYQKWSNCAKLIVASLFKCLNSYNKTSDQLLLNNGLIITCPKTCSYVPETARSSISLGRACSGVFANDMHICY